MVATLPSTEHTKNAVLESLVLTMLSINSLTKLSKSSGPSISKVVEDDEFLGAVAILLMILLFVSGSVLFCLIFS